MVADVPRVLVAVGQFAGSSGMPSEARLTEAALP
jgi:hypothetical protein